MPRSRSSGALSIESNARNDTFGLFFDSTFVIAAVNVVLPWSMCPMVPMFTCGLLRSNFSFAMDVESPASLFRHFSLNFRYDFFRDVLGNLFVLPEVHGETAAALRARAQLRRVAKHFR